jgi:hypothetical protein
LESITSELLLLKPMCRNQKHEYPYSDGPPDRYVPGWMSSPTRNVPSPGTDGCCVGAGRHRDELEALQNALAAAHGDNLELRRQLAQLDG